MWELAFGLCKEGRNFFVDVVDIGVFFSIVSDSFWMDSLVVAGRDFLVLVFWVDLFSSVHEVILFLLFYTKPKHCI